MNLINGDCLEKMKTIDENAVDLLFCDLPYGETDCKWDCLIDLKLFWCEVNRVCKINAPMFFTCSTKFGVSLINSNSKNFRYDMVWIKSVPVGFLTARKMPMRKHEMLYVFYRKQPLYDIDNNHTHTSKETTKNRKVGVYEGEPKSKISIIKKYTPTLPNSILEIPSEKGIHPTQKPVGLMEWILKYYTRENDLVLDPTMGSGSTGVACKNTNRNFIGIEMDEEIFKTAEERINNISLL